MQITLELIDIIIVIGISQGAFLSLTLSRIENNKSANKILSILLMIATVMLIGRFLFFRQLNFWVFQWSLWVDSLLFLFGPLLYTYVRRFLVANDSKFKIPVIQLVPFFGMVLLSLFFVVFYTPEAFYQAYLDRKFDIVFDIILISGIICNTYYLIQSFLILKDYKKNVRRSLSFYQQSINYLFLFLVSIGLFLFVWTLTFINEFLFDHYFAFINYNIVWSVIPVFIYVIGYFSLKQPELFRLPIIQETKKKRKRLNPEECIVLKEKLDQLMIKDRPYLNSNLTLKDVAQRLQTSTHNISWLLNNSYGTTFYDFINGYRVRAFLYKIENNEHLNQTILSLSMDVGFNSKSTFNKVFKLMMNETPSSYIRGLSAIQNM